jgi:acetyl esterase/lipase
MIGCCNGPVFGFGGSMGGGHIMERSNLVGLQPCLTVVSLSEILRDDALRLHDKLQTLGISSTCLQWKHTPHAFPVMARLLPEARDALRQTADFIARVLRA